MKGPLCSVLLSFLCIGSIHAESIDNSKLVNQSKESIEAYVAHRIKEHYAMTQGYLEMWGKIHLYILFHSDGKKYIFNIHGNLLAVETYSEESEAFLRLHNYTF